MDGRYIEPRAVMWAVAEVTWQDSAGTPHRAPATIVDRSPSGACLRVKRPFTVGSKVTIKWHREQFSAVTRNCRSEGWDFLLGVMREVEPLKSAAAEAKDATPVPPARVKTVPQEATATVPGIRSQLTDHESRRAARSHNSMSRTSSKLPAESIASSSDAIKEITVRGSTAERASSSSERQSRLPSPGPSPRAERKVMQSKTFFPHFWRRPNDGDAPAKPTSTEAPMNKPSTQPNTPSGPRGELLSYEDIYRAAGIMSPGSGYDIHKVVEMMNSDRIRDLSKDVKRASVLMALDAANISADELLTDATRRQNALTSYEAGQRKQLEDFEAVKAKENARVEEEMEKIRVHYAQRIQANLDQVTREKDALRNWQNAMQSESQRIAEVIELCGKQPAPQTASAMAAAAGAGASDKTESVSADAARTATPRPGPLAGK
jgi:hypothetical protein